MRNRALWLLIPRSPPLVLGIGVLVALIATAVLAVIELASAVGDGRRVRERVVATVQALLPAPGDRGGIGSAVARRGAACAG
jgi:hypothetical protein